MAQARPFTTTSPRKKGVYLIDVGVFESHVCVDPSKLLPYWSRESDNPNEIGTGNKLHVSIVIENNDGSEQRCNNFPAARIWFIEEIAKDDPINLYSDKTVAHGMHWEDCINRKYLRFKQIGPNLGENGCAGSGMCRHGENGEECWRPGTYCWNTELRDCDDARRRVIDDPTLTEDFRKALEDFADEWDKHKTGQGGSKITIVDNYI